MEPLGIAPRPLPCEGSVLLLALWPQNRSGGDCTHDLSVPNRTRCSCATLRGTILIVKYGQLNIYGFGSLRSCTPHPFGHHRFRDGRQDYPDVRDPFWKASKAGITPASILSDASESPSPRIRPSLGYVFVYRRQESHLSDNPYERSLISRCVGLKPKVGIAPTTSTLPRSYSTL